MKYRLFHNAHLYVTGSDRAFFEDFFKNGGAFLKKSGTEGASRETSFPLRRVARLSFCCSPNREKLKCSVIMIYAYRKKGDENIAIYHNSIKMVSRGSGRSVVAAAAYRSGTKLINEWDDLPADYSYRTCVVHSEIMLPKNAPDSFHDRQTLWNSVEMNEKRRDAQLAREIEVALPKELPMEENIKLVKEYCQQFVDAGMCVDLNIHDKQDGNPHAHILLTIRALDEKGKWLPKSHEEYELDENGDRIRGPNGRYISHKVFTTDWDSHENAELWRTSWEETVNRYLEANGISERIDHRSNADRGIEEIPAIHMGPTACAMEKRGIMTDRGNINRMIRAANRIIRESLSKIKEIGEWMSALAEVIKELDLKESSPSLNEVMGKYLEQEEERTLKYSGTFRLKHMASELKEVRESLQRLEDKGIVTVADLDGKLTEMKDNTTSIKERMNPKGKRMKELETLIDNGDKFLQTDPVHKELTGIKWKKTKETFEETHHPDLIIWNAANRFFHAKEINTSELPELMTRWRTELSELTKSYNEDYSELKETRAEVKELDDMHRKVERVLKSETEEDKTKAEKKEQNKNNENR